MRVMFEVVLQSLHLAVRGPNGETATGILHFPSAAEPVPATARFVSRKTPKGQQIVAAQQERIAQLPPLTRKVLKLRAKGLSGKEIGKKCKISASSVHTRVYEARKKGIRVDNLPVRVFPVPKAVEEAILGNGKRRF